MGSAKPLRLLVMAMALVVTTMVVSPRSQAQVAVGISVNFGPPELPVYEQPICPGDGYIWTPGYWAWDPDFDDYYWVPGTWVLAPEPGFLWTPPYWGWNGVAFVFYQGYWGPRVGFYGGIDYGYGYFGHGYEGGRWEGNRFYYNRTVNNINVTEIHNVYNTTIVNHNETRVSYNGGNGGINARATAEDQAAGRERHITPVAAQQQHWQEARSDRGLRASENHGRPPIAATPRPGSFSGGGVVAARSGGNYNPPPNRGRNTGSRAVNENGRPGGSNAPNARTDRPPNARTESGTSNRPTYVHPNELPKANRPEFTPSGNAKADQRYQQQEQKLYQKQEQEHQKLQQRQDQEHARSTQTQPNEAQRQQMEQRHQQQTQHLEERHTQEQQRMEQRAPTPRQQAPPPHGGEPHH